MKFEDLLEEIDGFGRFQKLVLFLSFTGRFALPCHFLLNNYIGAVPDHHCDVSFLDHVLGNLTHEQKLTVSIPKQEDGTFESCHMFAEPRLHLLDQTEFDYNVSLIECPNGWEHDKSNFASTISTQVTRRTLLSEVNVFLTIREHSHSFI